MENKTIIIGGKTIRLKKDGTPNLTDLPKELREVVKASLKEKRTKDFERFTKELLDNLK